MKIQLYNKGFTLIELLVVISIISLLASVVLASITSARSKGKDASIKEEASQLVNLMNLNYNTYGSYCNFQFGWVTSVAGCASIANGTYGANAQSICTNIYNNAVDAGSGMKIYLNTAGVGGCAATYSMMIYLNDGKWFCSGSSGSRAEYPAYSNYSDGHDYPPGTPGCYEQP